MEIRNNNFPICRAIIYDEQREGIRLCVHYSPGPELVGTEKVDGIGISDNPFCLHHLTLSVSFCKRIGWKGCLLFVQERGNGLPVAAQNVNKGSQFSVITTRSPCIGNLIAKRPSALCPFGKNVQIIAVHIAFVTLPPRGFPEDFDFFQLRHKCGCRLVGDI